MRLLVAALGLVSTLIAACASAGAKAAAPASEGYPVGTFVDACGTLIESITLTPDSAFIRDGGSEAVSRRSGDTTFFESGVVAFLRQREAKGSWRYYFAYCHRCSAGKWPVPILWVEVLPSAKHVPGKAYRARLDPPGLLKCEEAGDPEPDSR